MPEEQSRRNIYVSTHGVAREVWHEVQHPECIIVMKTKVVVGYPDEDRTVHCDLIHINSVESLQTT